MRSYFLSSSSAYALGMVLLSGNAHAGPKDAPLPDDVSITQASPDVPDALKPFAGKWIGEIYAFSNHQAHTLVVERIEAQLAWVIWSVGPNVYMNGAGWYRVPARLTSDGLTVYLGDAIAKYKLSADGELEISGQRRGFGMTGRLKRENTTIRPFSAGDMPPTYWPPGIDSLQPGSSESPVAATFPSQKIEPPSSDTPAEYAKWLGRWSGWGCAKKECDMKLAVLRISGNQARIVQLFAAKGIEPNPSVRDAVFYGDELRLKAGGLRVSYRMRRTGEVEVFRAAANGALAWGVMTKEP